MSFPYGRAPLGILLITLAAVAGVALTGTRHEGRRTPDLIFAVFIPAFHALPYLLFPWRYQLNMVASEVGPSAATPEVKMSRPALMRFAKFVAWGLVLGWVGFMGLPSLFHAGLSPDPTLFGPAVFVFIFVMWINIHHYFIDNVIWRRDNEDVRKYLFAPR